jgi:hypothetical protein
MKINREEVDKRPKELNIKSREEIDKSPVLISDWLKKLTVDTKHHIKNK